MSKIKQQHVTWAAVALALVSLGEGVADRVWPRDEAAHKAAEQTAEHLVAVETTIRAMYDRELKPRIEILVEQADRNGRRLDGVDARVLRLEDKAFEGPPAGWRATPRSGVSASVVGAVEPGAGAAPESEAAAPEDNPPLPSYETIQEESR